jgi:hypothetical protein
MICKVSKIITFTRKKIDQLMILLIWDNLLIDISFRMTYLLSEIGRILREDIILPSEAHE